MYEYSFIFNEFFLSPLLTAVLLLGKTRQIQFNEVFLSLLVN